MSSKFLYRRLGSAVIVILAFFPMVPQSAGQGRPQLKRPAEDTVEKPPEVKKPKVKGPRAVGILQLTSAGKATLIPVAILIDGKFHDASIYKADPVPMALDSGTVYEAEQAGDSKGLFTVSGALHSKNPGSANPWVGMGAYLPPGAKVDMDSRRAEDVPVGLDSGGSDEPPRLTRGKAAAPNSNAPATGTNASGAKPSSDKTAGGGASDKADKSTTSSASSGGSSDKSSTTKPPVGSDKNASTSNNTAESAKPSTSAGQASPQSQDSQNYYRPTLRRGKPTQSAPDEDETPAKTVNAASETGLPKTPTGPADGGPLQLVPAISDAGGPDPRSYKFFWKEGEEDERRQQMLALAGDEVRAYANAKAKNMISAKAPTTKAGGPTHKPAAKPVQPVLENVQFRGFDVWGNNQPVMILSAEAHLPAATQANSTPESYGVTLVARTDIYGNLRKLYSGVTDKFHLDVTPRLELIDAVDADGDGRGELLFRETTDAGNGYVIYRATADKLWKMFDSLGEE